MKIAYFNGSFKKEDGVVRVILALVEQAKKQGVETAIVATKSKDTEVSPVPLMEINSVEIPFYRDYSLAFPGIKGFEKKLDEWKPDIIHINSPDTVGWAGLKYAKKNNIPIVATFHTYFSRYLGYYHLSFAESFAFLKNGTVMVAISMATAMPMLQFNLLLEKGL